MTKFLNCEILYYIRTQVAWALEFCQGYSIQLSYSEKAKYCSSKHLDRFWKGIRQLNSNNAIKQWMNQQNLNLLSLFVKF